MNLEVPKWVLQLDRGISERASTVLIQSELTEATARDLLKRWTSRNFLARKDLLDKGIPIAVQNSALIKIEQLRHHEERSVVSRTEPDNGKRYEKQTSLEGIWDKNPIKKFENKSSTWIRGGSGSSSSCSNCRGHGKNTCSTCKGERELTCSSCSGAGIAQCKKCSGAGLLRIKCPNCRGKGSIPKSGIAVGGTIRGGLGGGLVFSNEQCQRCGATGLAVSQCDRCNGKGELDCIWCSGSGIVRCHTCKGSGSIGCRTCGSTGRLYSFDVISASARILKQQFLFGFNPPMKESWFKKLKKADSQTFEIKNSILIEADPNPPPKEGRVLFEKYVVSIIPVTVVSLALKRPVSVYIVGSGRRVRNYSRLLNPLSVIIISTLILGSLIAAGALLLRQAW